MMRALVLKDGGSRVVTDFELPTPGADEVRVRTRLVGVCDTDLQLGRGYMGFSGVPGHEFVGTVMGGSPERSPRAPVGQRVVADINAGCGQCEDCVTRDGHHCLERTVLGILGRPGAMAEELLIPSRCLVPVPEDLSDELAVFAEPLAAALHVLDALPAGFKGPVVVLGDGKLGLLIAHALLGAGLPTRVVGRHQEKLALAEAAGAEVCLEADRERLGLVDAVVEATGTAGGFSQALAMLRPRGTLILKTTVAGGIDADLAPIVINELRVVGSRCGNIAKAIEFMASGRVDPTSLIAARYPLSKADEALQQAGVRGTLKVLIDTEMDA
jgi:threonine dehydrogenase-like Zn-dependent dehydrogenase